MLKKFELNKKGVIEIMKSSEMQKVLSAKAKEIQSRCGTGDGSDFCKNSGSFDY